MPEKWFQFVQRIKKEHNFDSLKEAMSYASNHKEEWRNNGPSLSKHGGKRRKTRRHKGGDGEGEGDSDSGSGSDSDSDILPFNEDKDPKDKKEAIKDKQPESDPTSEQSAGRRHRRRKSKRTRKHRRTVRRGRSRGRGKGRR